MSSAVVDHILQMDGAIVNDLDQFEDSRDVQVLNATTHHQHLQHNLEHGYDRVKWGPQFMRNRRKKVSSHDLTFLLKFHDPGDISAHSQ